MKKIFLLIILAVIVLPLQSRAAIESYKLLEPLPCIDQTQPCENGQVKEVDLASYVGYIFRLVIALAGAIAVFRITWGGFKYMTTDAVFGKQEGKKEIKDAIYGLIMIFASYLILRTIDPRLVEIKTEITPIQRADEIDINSLFTEINAREEILNRAASTTGRLLEQERLLREERAQASSTEAVDRITQQLLQIEWQRNRINFDATLESNYLGAEQMLDSHNESYVSDTFKEQINEKIAGIEGAAQRNIQRMRNAGDVQGAESLDQKRNLLVSKAKDGLDTLDNTLNMVHKFDDMFIVNYSVPSIGSTRVKINQEIVKWDQYISTLKAKSAAFPNTNAEYKTDYTNFIQTKITEIEKTLNAVKRY